MFTIFKPQISLNFGIAVGVNMDKTWNNKYYYVTSPVFSLKIEVNKSQDVKKHMNCS